MNRRQYLTSLASGIVLPTLPALDRPADQSSHRIRDGHGEEQVSVRIAQSRTDPSNNICSVCGQQSHDHTVFSFEESDDLNHLATQTSRFKFSDWCVHHNLSRITRLVDDYHYEIRCNDSVIYFHP